MKYRPYLCLFGMALMVAGPVQKSSGASPIFVYAEKQQTESANSQQDSEQKVGSKYPADISKFIQQAEKLFAEFDKDKDQKLTAAEFNSLTAPPENADVNGDGFVDKVELIKALILSENASKPSRQNPSPPFVQDKPSDPSIQNRGPQESTRGNDVYNRYADGLFKAYDLNNDEKLDRDEMSSMRRPPQNADKNGDGFVDRQELISFVSQRISQPVPKNSKQDKLEALLLQRIEERKRALAVKQTKAQRDPDPKQLTTPGALDLPTSQLAKTNDRLRSLRIQRRDVLKRMTELLSRQYSTGTATLKDIFEAQSNLLEANLQLATDPNQRLQIYQKNIVTKRGIVEQSRRLAVEGVIAGVKVLYAEAELLEAEIRLAEEQNRSVDRNNP